jgi:type IV secretory pathway component VirB8
MSLYQSLFDRLSPGRKSAPKTAPPMYEPDTAPLQRDELGSYLIGHDTPQASQRHGQKTAVLAIAVMGISLAINAVLSVVILEMFPLYRVVPMFVTFSDKSDQVVTIDPPRANLTSLDILTEADVRQYILQRHTVSDDPQETINRWGGKVRVMSSQQVYNDFLTETKPIYESLSEKRFTRSITIHSLSRTQPGYYHAEIETTDHRLGSGLTDSGEEHREFNIDLRVVNQQQAVRYDDRFLNPLGFTVINYAIAPKK